MKAERWVEGETDMEKERWRKVQQESRTDCEVERGRVGCVGCFFSATRLTTGLESYHKAPNQWDTFVHLYPGIQSSWKTGLQFSLWFLSSINHKNGIPRMDIHVNGSVVGGLPAILSVLI